MARPTVSFTPILPKSDFDAKYYRDAWEHAMRQKVKPDLQKLFKDTVEGWKHRVVFRGTINKSTHFLRLLVKAIGKNAELYAMIDVTGARKHPIAAKNAKVLSFQSGYSPSTSPRVLSSRANRRYGRIVQTPYLVNQHPGFEPREFSKTIAEQYQPEYVRIMQDATDKATTEMGRRL